MRKNVSNAYIKYILIKKLYINSKIVFLKEFETIFFETKIHSIFFLVFNFLIHISYANFVTKKIKYKLFQKFNLIILSFSKIIDVKVALKTV